VGSREFKNDHVGQGSPNVVSDIVASVRKRQASAWARRPRPGKLVKPVNASQSPVSDRDSFFS
jgi:hypothetical protein